MEVPYGKQSDPTRGLNAKDRTKWKKSTPPFPQPRNQEKRQRSQLLKERKRGSLTQGSYVGATLRQPTRGTQACVGELVAAATAVRRGAPCLWRSGEAPNPMMLIALQISSIISNS